MKSFHKCRHCTPWLFPRFVKIELKAPTPRQRRGVAKYRLLPTRVLPLPALSKKNLLGLRRSLESIPPQGFRRCSEAPGVEVRFLGLPDPKSANPNLVELHSFIQTLGPREAFQVLSVYAQEHAVFPLKKSPKSSTLKKIGRKPTRKQNP